MPTAWRALIPGKGLAARPIEAFLLDRGPSREAIVTGLAGPNAPAAFAAPHDYLVVNSRGAPVNEYNVITWAFEDEQGATAYDIHNTAFRRLNVTVTGPSGATKLEISVLIDNLTPAPIPTCLTNRPAPPRPTRPRRKCRPSAN